MPVGSVIHERADTESDVRDPQLGRVLSDRYRVLGVLGRGGMGTVYRGEHVLIQRPVAIKMLHPQLTASNELVQRFHREARAAALSCNEHVADATDMGRLEDGSYYIVLEYLEGKDLAALVAENGPLPIGRAVAIVRQLCVALEAVHAAGIVHRDLKPENIFLIRRSNQPDFVKVLDFGICKFLKDQPLTVTGVAMGTPRFMSPEQLEARPEVDRRADVYGAGAILYFALTGQGPFDRESLPRLLMSIWSDPAPRLRELRPDAPAALDEIVARTLEKAPDRRFADARELYRALEAIAGGHETEAFQAPPAPPHWGVASGVRDANLEVTSVPGLRRARTARLTGAALLLALSCGSIAWALWPVEETPLAPPRSEPPAPAVEAQPEREAEPVPTAPLPVPAQTSAPRRPLKRAPSASAAPAQPTAAEPPAAAPVEQAAPPEQPTAPVPPARPLAPRPQRLKPVF